MISSRSVRRGAGLIKQLNGLNDERVLSEVELAAVFRTAWTGDAPFHRLVCFLLLLGLRRTEAANLHGIGSMRKHIR